MNEGSLPDDETRQAEQLPDAEQSAATRERNDQGEPVSGAPAEPQASAEEPQQSQPMRSASTEQAAKQETPAARKLRIGSQRWPTRMPPKPAPVPVASPPAPQTAEPDASQSEVKPPAAEETPVVAPEAKPAPLPVERAGKRPRAPAPTQHKIQPPSTRGELSPDLQLELAEALGGVSLDDIMATSGSVAREAELEPETRTQGRVIAVVRDSVFIDLGGPKQGVVPLRNFQEPPEVGAALDVVVVRFDPAEGLYELMRPGGAVDVGDWSEVAEGMVVEARVTGHNKGGLECEVGKLRGFIPASQASLYRVEDLAQFVGEKFVCVVTEANPEQRNLVLSRRGVLEREKAEAKQNLLAELEVGQMREGVVRSLQDFGAFVDLGGIDGLIHISQLSWDRIRHASEVLELGQKVKVKIQKIDAATGKIGLGFRDLAENPWNSAARKYPTRSKVKGTVSRIMEFGAFVKLEPGIEGLVHISEISHKRVWRASDIVSEGQEVEVLVLSVDEEKQRISLSLKALEARPAAAQTQPEESEEATAEAPQAARRKSGAPLKGGVSKSSGGEQFGLKW